MGESTVVNADFFFLKIGSKMVGAPWKYLMFLEENIFKRPVGYFHNFWESFREFLDP